MSVGTLVIVGTGIKLGAHCTIEARGWIKTTDVVFMLTGDPIADEWIRSINSNAISLQDCYGEGRTRHEAYHLMTERMLAPVRQGLQVCAAFYGHPGIFVRPTHEAIKIARAEGHSVVMLPGVSAEACMFADLNVDPAEFGCQTYEATDFVLRKPNIEKTASLVLWQIGMFGDLTFKSDGTTSRKILHLIKVLRGYYPQDHKVIVYEAAVLPISKPSIQQLEIKTLHKAKLSQGSTLYIGPTAKVDQNYEELRALGFEFNS